MSKSEVNRFDATPSKRIYRSIIADYSLETAIPELIDNALDAWKTLGGGQSLAIDIVIDVDQQSIWIKDNSGGVKEAELKKLVSPGESSLTGAEHTIGIFGVGSKRAVVALAAHVQITTRFRRESTFQVEYDDTWLSTDSWDLPYYRMDSHIDPSTTHVLLSRLRFRISETAVESLREHLGATYAYLLTGKGISISLNQSPIVPVRYDNWSFPPEFEPRRFFKTIERAGSTARIKCELTAGLRCEKDDSPNDYGVCFYCNERLIARFVRGPEVGFITGLAGVPHPQMSLARIIVKLTGPSADMPWNSSKSGINYNHDIFTALRDDVCALVKTYVGISKRLSETFDTQVKPFNQGEVIESKLAKAETIKPSKLPAIPRVRRSTKEDLFAANRELTAQKPWVRGILESIAVEEMVTKQRGFEQRNRLSLIILDSTVEIALKDFLAYEIPNPPKDENLAKLFGNRFTVHEEVKKYLGDGEVWVRLAYFYKLRCDLIHKRASAGISDSEIYNFRNTVKELMELVCGASFPEAD